MERYENILLDDHCFDILRVIYNRNSASTADLRLDDDVEIEDNDRIRSRVYKLEDVGLVDVRDADYSLGGAPPKVAMIAEEDAAADLLNDPGRRPVDALADRVCELERVVNEYEELFIMIIQAFADHDIDVREHQPGANRH